MSARITGAVLASADARSAPVPLGTRSSRPIKERRIKKASAKTATNSVLRDGITEKRLMNFPERIFFRVSPPATAPDSAADLPCEQGRDASENQCSCGTDAPARLRDDPHAQSNPS